MEGTKGWVKPKTMIKFFRNIRKNLLSEGKTAKYLKYAIGEIALVMIGILLALQVNNWNDERKAKIDIDAIRQSNLQEIYNDLKKDVIVLDTILNQLQRQKEASKYTLEVVESNNKFISDSIKFIQKQFITSHSVAVDRTKNTWDNLNSSGQLLSLKEEELNKKLFDYYTYYDSRIKHFNELPKEIRLKYRIEVAPCYDLGNVQMLLEQNPNLISINAKWFSCFLSMDELHDSLISIYLSSSLNINWFGEVKTQAQSIIEYIEDNLKLEINRIKP